MLISNKIGPKNEEIIPAIANMKCSIPNIFICSLVLFRCFKVSKRNASFEPDMNENEIPKIRADKLNPSIPED